MTTKERLHKIVDELSEREAADTLEYVASRHENASADEWGDLSTFGTTLMGEAFQRLDEEERAELGETIAEAFERERPG